LRRGIASFGCFKQAFPYEFAPQYTGWGKGVRRHERAAHASTLPMPPGIAGVPLLPLSQLTAETPPKFGDVSPFRTVPLDGLD
jgi:hypothetical protein